VIANILYKSFYALYLTDLSVGCSLHFTDFVKKNLKFTFSPVKHRSESVFLHICTVAPNIYLKCLHVYENLLIITLSMISSNYFLDKDVCCSVKELWYLESRQNC
jgi:hypothetical protein